MTGIQLEETYGILSSTHSGRHGEQGGTSELVKTVSIKVHILRGPLISFAFSETILLIGKIYVKKHNITQKFCTVPFKTSVFISCLMLHGPKGQ